MSRRKAAAVPEEATDRADERFLERLADYAAALSLPSRLPYDACDASELFQNWDGLMWRARREPFVVPEIVRAALSELDGALTKLGEDHRSDSFERLQTRHGWRDVQRSASGLAEALTVRRNV